MIELIKPDDNKLTDEQLLQNALRRLKEVAAIMQVLQDERDIKVSFGINPNEKTRKFSVTLNATRTLLG